MLLLIKYILIIVLAYKNCFKIICKKQLGNCNKQLYCMAYSQ